MKTVFGDFNAKFVRENIFKLHEDINDNGVGIVKLNK
jgi:hypothetical protein